MIDRVARTLTDAQLSALRALRRSVVNELELRRNRAELRLLADAFRRSQSDLRRALAVAKMAYFVTNADGSFERWSETLASLAGVEEERLPRTAAGWLELVHPEDREAFRAKSREAAENGGPVTIQYRLRRPDGACIDIHQEIERLDAERDAQARRQCIGTLRDVTEHKQARRSG